MQRILISFVVGMFTAAVAVAAGDVPLVMFGLGFMAAVLILLVCLGSARRLNAAAERLAQLAEWIAAKPARRPRASTKLNPNKTLVMPDSREAALVSALVNLGSGRPAARAAARYALQEGEPGATIPDLVRIAVKAPQAAA